MLIRMASLFVWAPSPDVCRVSIKRKDVGAISTTQLPTYLVKEADKWITPTETARSSVMWGAWEIAFYKAAY